MRIEYCVPRITWANTSYPLLIPNGCSHDGRIQSALAPAGFLSTWSNRYFQNDGPTKAKSISSTNTTKLTIAGR